LNIGPDSVSKITVGELASALYEAFGLEPNWTYKAEPGSLESRHLSLDPSLARKTLGWSSAFSDWEAVKRTADWYASWRSGKGGRTITAEQIRAYETSAGK
jgi:nucleoside-diphosphate-sugar epimerase